jgi:hypothetical protein
MLPPFQLLNATAPPAPLWTGAPGEITICNDSVPINNFSDPQPIRTEPGIGDDSGPDVFDPVPIFEPIETPGREPHPEEPPTTWPMDPIFVDPMYPPPPMEAQQPPSVSISTFLAVVQPLLDIISTLLPPGEGGWAPTLPNMPFGMGPKEKRSVAANQYIGAVTEKGKPFFRNLMMSIVASIQSLLHQNPAGPAVNTTDSVTNAVGTLDGFISKTLRIRQMGIVGHTKPLPSMVEPVYGDVPANTSDTVSTTVPVENMDMVQQLLAVLDSLIGKFRDASTFSKRSASSALAQLRTSLSYIPSPVRPELLKRQRVSPSFIRCYIGEFHVMYPVLAETDPSITAGLEEIMSNPNLPVPPFESLDTSLMTDAMKQFVIHTFIFMTIITDPAVPNERRSTRSWRPWMLAWIERG